MAWPFLTHFLHCLPYLIKEHKPKLIFFVLLIGVNTSCKNSRKNIVIQISMFVTFRTSANDYKVLDEYTDNNNGFKRECQIQDKKSRIKYWFCTNDKICQMSSRSCLIHIKICAHRLKVVWIKFAWILTRIGWLWLGIGQILVRCL